MTAYAVSGSSEAADFHASSAPASPAQNRAIPRLSCTAALFGCSPDSCVSPATVPSGQLLNASPTRASRESCRAKSFSASRALAGLVEAKRLAEVDCLGVDADAEVERERRCPAAYRRPGSRSAGRLVARGGGDPGDGTSDDDGEHGDHEDHAGAGAHGGTVAATAVDRRGASTRAEPEAASTRHHAILLKVMATYRELLAQVKDEIDEVSTSDVLDRLDDLGPPTPARCSGAGRVAGGPSARRDPHRARQPRVTRRGRDPRPRARDRHLLRSRRTLRVRREVADRARLHERVLDDRRLHRLEAERLRVHHAACPQPRAASPLLAPHPHSRGRRGGPAEAARRARAPDRRRRARLAVVALSRGGRRRHARHRRRRRRRRLESAAPDRPLHEHARRAEGAAPPSGRSRRSTPTST